jgi:hypothetical protein
LIDHNAGRVRVDKDRVGQTDLYDRTLTGEPIADQAAAALRTHHLSQKLRDQLLMLTPDLYERTLGSLIAAGLMVQRRRAFGRHHYVPADRWVTTLARGGPRRAVQDTNSWDGAADALCALLRVLRLHDTLYLGTAIDIDQQLVAITERLRRQAPHPYNQVPVVVDAVNAAAGDIAVDVYVGWVSMNSGGPQTAEWVVMATGAAKPGSMSPTPRLTTCNGRTHKRFQMFVDDMSRWIGGMVWIDS